MLDYRIETFIALCETMNYGKAAEATHVTQPAVTRHIQSLEEAYGCKLFTYEHRVLSLTPEGERLLRHVRNAAYQESKFVESLSPQRGIHLRIGATRTVGDYAIGAHVAHFLEDPDNSIAVSVSNTRHLLGRIDKGLIDFAVIEGTFDRTRYASELYSKEPFAGICPTSHPFAGQTVSLADAMGECLVLREKGSGTREILEQTLAATSHSVSEFSRIVTATSFALISQLLVSLGAITFGYEVLCLPDGSLTTFQIEGWDIVREFNYVSLDNDDAKAAVESFKAFRP